MNKLLKLYNLFDTIHRFFWIGSKADLVYTLRCQFVCVFVPSAGTRNRVYWRLLVTYDILFCKNKFGFFLIGFTMNIHQEI